MSPGSRSAQLFHFVVDDDAVATALLKEVQKVNAGRITFMPLAQLERLAAAGGSANAEPRYPATDDAVPLLSKLKFKPAVRAAVSHVFRRCLVVRNLEVGAKLSRGSGFDCVTIDGDRTNASGTLTGGFVDLRASRLAAHSSAAATAQRASELTEELQAKRRALDQARSLQIRSRCPPDSSPTLLEQASAGLPPIPSRFHPDSLPIPFGSLRIPS